MPRDFVGVCNERHSEGLRQRGRSKRGGRAALCGAPLAQGAQIAAQAHLHIRIIADCKTKAAVMLHFL